jgi:hypothetical protein
MQVQLPFGIASISGKIGNTVFYYRNGKQFARRLNKTLPTGSPQDIANMLWGERRQVEP